MLELQASSTIQDNPRSTIPAEYATGPTCSCDSQDGHRSGKLKIWPIEPECPRSVYQFDFIRTRIARDPGNVSIFPPADVGLFGNDE